MKSFTALLLACAVILISSHATAEVLLVDAVAQNPQNSAQGLLRPTTGQTMARVRQQFGTPDNELPWIGNPPISRWVYADFTVYFEHEHVITTVVHRK